MCHTCRDLGKPPKYTVKGSVPGVVALKSGEAAPAEAPSVEGALRDRNERQAESKLRAEHRLLTEEVARLRVVAREAEKVVGPTIIVYDSREDESTDAVACALASDWHIEEPVDPGAVNGLNAYDLDVARARCQAFFRNVLKLTSIFAREQRIKRIDLQVLGDMFSGWIHEELIANALLAPGDAAQEFSSMFASGVAYLLDEGPFDVTGVMIPGNHGRLTDKMHIGNPTGTSLETVAYHSVASKFAGNPRVRLEVARHAVVYRRFHESFVVRHIHGYEVKYGGGVGGLTIPLNRKIARWDTATRASLTTLGHFHQKFDGGSFLVNGSLIGYNAFAQAIGASYEPPQQVFYLVDARNGGEKTVVAPVFV
jgi:hypothetical protein